MFRGKDNKMNIPKEFLDNQVFDARPLGFNRQLIPVRELNRKDGLLIGSDWHFPGQIKLYCIEP
jgi:hypothetical protein